MAPDNVLSADERNRNFYEADKRIREARSELGQLRTKGLRIRDLCMELKEILDKPKAIDMVSAWELKKEITPEAFQSWPDISIEGLNAFMKAIKDTTTALREAEEEMEALRGLR